MIPVCTCTIWRTDFLSQQAQNMIMPCMSQLLLLAFAGSASVDALPCCEMGDPEKERVAHTADGACVEYGLIRRPGRGCEA